MSPPNCIAHRSARWKSLYEDLISDPECWLRIERIADARNAIFDRAEEILSKPSSEERQALNHALRTLRLLEATIRERKAA